MGLVRRRPHPRRGDRGSVTAETAVVLPALASVLALSVWAVATVTAQLQCVDAARVAARALARGEAASASTEVARQAAPDGATVSVLRTGDLVIVEVRAVSRLPGPWRGRGPSVDVGGRATAAVEGAAADLGPVSGLGGELP